MNETETEKQKVVDYIKTSLGDGMIDVELDPKHYDLAIDIALRKYRQRSQNSEEESFGYITLQTYVNENQLAPEVMQVRQIFRRSIGSRSGGGDGGTLFEPFNLAYSNTYLLSSSNMGGLATYMMFSQYQNLVGKMFGSFINFDWNSVTKKLRITQRPRGEENVLLWMYNYKPDFILFQDTWAGIWIRDYAVARAKVILGEAREKFATIASPQGGTNLNGTALKSEGKAEMEILEQDLINNKDNQQPLTFVIG
jgi:hypothetical protein